MDNLELNETETDLPDVTQVEPVEKLARKDIREAAQMLDLTEIRYLVDYYYTEQKARIQSNNKVQALRDSGKPCTLMAHLRAQHENLEAQVKSALHEWVKVDPVGKWLMQFKGIGPIMAANLVAEIYPVVGTTYNRGEKAAWRVIKGEGGERFRSRVVSQPGTPKMISTVSDIWSFAGLNPTQTWEKGQMRPFNAHLKKTCWLIGQSFLKNKGRLDENPNNFYVYQLVNRYHYELAKNERREYAEQAARQLATKNFVNKDAIATLKDGKLLNSHLWARACRYSVKMLLAHLVEVIYLEKFDMKVPSPYSIQFGGHAHVFPLPLPYERSTEATEAYGRNKHEGK